jgi:hypothetical protein
MMIGRLALAVLVSGAAGCGRVGFQELSGHGGDDDGGAADHTVALTVTSDQSASAPAGAPIAGATVMIQRAAGAASERLTTDATGSARFAADGVVAFHVAYHAGASWRVYTVAAPPAGAITLGGRPLAAAFSHAMTFAVPDNGSSNFWLHLGAACAISTKEGSASFRLDYAAGCEGTTTHVIAFTTAAGTSQDRYIDAGSVTLSNGGRKTVTGAYATPAAHTVQITNLLGLVSSASAGIYARDGLDLVELGGDFDSATPSAGTATVTTTAAPGGNALRVSTFGDLPIQYSSTSERIVPATVASQMSFDASAMVPLFSQLMLTSPPSVAWTGGAGDGSILALEITSGALQWDAYLPPSATSVRFPDLPGDLGAPVPNTYDYASLVRLDVPGATAADLLPAIDRTSVTWPSDRAVFPATGSGVARIVYSVGLGPP